MAGKVIAVCGKGGVGKTTISAVFAQHLSAQKGVTPLIVDADHAGGLCMALGIDPEQTLSDVRSKAMDEVKGGTTSKTELSHSIDYFLTECLVEGDGYGFLPLGRPENKGCYCSVNTLLKRALEILSGKFDVTVIDAEAGIEQVSREVMASVDYLLLVSDTSAKGLRVAADIQQAAGALGLKADSGLVLNRLEDEQEADRAADKTALDVIGRIPADHTIRIFDAEEKPFFELPDCPAKSAIIPILKSLLI